MLCVCCVRDNRQKHSSVHIAVVELHSLPTSDCVDFPAGSVADGDNVNVDQCSAHDDVNDQCPADDGGVDPCLAHDGVDDQCSAHDDVDDPCPAFDGGVDQCPADDDVDEQCPAFDGGVDPCPADDGVDDQCPADDVDDTLCLANDDDDDDDEIDDVAEGDINWNCDLHDFLKVYNHNCLIVKSVYILCCIFHHLQIGIFINCIILTGAEPLMESFYRTVIKVQNFM